MLRVLIASASDWLAAARLPSTLGPAGFEVHLVDRGNTHASASAWVRGRTTVAGSTEAIAAHVLDVAHDFDRVLVCDESLLHALLDSRDPLATALLPAHPDALRAMLDKTRFPEAAAAAGLRVPDWRVATTPAGLDEAIEALGCPVILKGRHGHGGRAVRAVRDASKAPDIAAKLGYPVIVETLVAGEVGLMPCLFEHGELVAAFAAKKHKTMRRFGPSSVNVLWEIDDGLHDVARKAGSGFGLHGYASIDLVRTPDGESAVIEINPRPVAQLHLGRRIGVDMAGALHTSVEGTFDGMPRLSGPGGRIALFPRELERLRRRHGAARGTLRWLTSPGALGDVPWNDPPLALRHLRRR